MQTGPITRRAATLEHTTLADYLFEPEEGTPTA